MERVRGFRDIYPEDMEIREKIFRESDTCSRLFGFRKIDFPSVEFLDLYRMKSGDELVQQTFSFRDRNQREITLIPEATPTVVRMLTARKDLPRPVRWYSFQKFWRYEEPQAGRMREFYQYNADIFGPDSMEADSEIIMLSMRILDSIGLKKRYQIRVNNREMMQALLENLGFRDVQKAFQAIDRMRKLPADQFLDEISSLIGSRKDSTELVELLGKPMTAADLRSLASGRKEWFSGMDDVVERTARTVELCSSGSPSEIVIDLSIVRGLSYYTGIVFEAFDADGEFRSILGGGRYNGLASTFSGESIPAVGVGMGDAVLELMMRKYGCWKTDITKKSVYVCRPPNSDTSVLAGIAATVRNLGIACMTDLSSRSLSAQFKDAARSGCAYAIICGDAEREKESVTIKNLESGKQELVRLDSLEKFLVEATADS